MSGAETSRQESEDFRELKLLLKAKEEIKAIKRLLSSRESGRR